MQTIGLIGGMSWESTVEYYRLINERIEERLGGSHSALLVLYSVDFAEIAALQRRSDWDRATALMVDAGRRVRAAGADFLVLCTNTMHRMAQEVEAQAGLPLLHIADVTAAAVAAAGLRRVGLLGTRYTMEQEFYRGRLEKIHGLSVLVPGAPERDEVHDIIYDELVRGVIDESSRRRYREIIGGLGERGAEGIILGCTEIGLLVGPGDVDLPVFDTTRLHARAAADRAIDG